MIKKFISNCKKNLFTIFIMTFICVISIVSIIKKDTTFSSIENKLLTQYKQFSINSFFDKSYMDNLENYLSDQFPYRNELICMNTYSKKYLLLEKNINKVYLGKNGYLFNSYTTMDFNNEQIEKNINSLKYFQNKYNCKVYLIPSSFEILEQNLPFVHSNINPNEYLKDIPNIDYVDNLLKPHKNEYIYYKTDHHWTTYGAYLLYKTEFDNNASYNTNVVSTNFLGTIHSRLNIKNSYDKIESPTIGNNLFVKYDYTQNTNKLYYEEHLTTKDQYSYFLDGNHAIIEITNPNVENGHLLVIKDSFANCFVPFLTNDYHKIDVIDMRYLNIPISNILKNSNYDDIIVLYNKVNFMTDKHIYKLSK